MLREPAKIAQWHGWDVPDLDEEIDQIYFSDAVESNDHKELTVDGGDRFILEPVPDGIQVSVKRAPADENSEWGDFADEITDGWSIFLQQLRFSLERHPNGHRRTAYFGGVPREPGSIMAKLGLDKLPDAGEEYTATLPTGVQLSGRVWFKTDRQLGLTVHSYAEHGDGLLVLADQDPGDGGPDGASSMLIASSYDLGAKALREMWAGWEAFRAENYPEADELATSELK